MENYKLSEYKLKGSPIAYYISGNAQKEWVLFLHAAFVNHHMFRQQTDYFRDQYNLLIPDLIGHGHSTDTKKGDNIDKMSFWIHEILKNEKIEQIHIVGISLGAVLAQDFANQYPEKVQSLACFGGYDINNFDLSLQKQNNGAQIGMMLKAIFSVKWFAKSNKKISAYTVQAQEDFYKMNIGFPKKSFMYLAGLNKMVNVRETNKRNYPLLIGCGQYDIPMELTAVEMWKKNEPECKAVIFEGAGHCVNMDVPEKFHEVLEEFWKSSQKKPYCHTDCGANEGSRWICGRNTYFLYESLTENPRSTPNPLRIQCKNKYGRGISVKSYIEERAMEIARYIIDNNTTVRQAAKHYGISKSTVHKDVTERLAQIHPALAAEARKVLDVNKSERHIRGGLATKEKYLHQLKI